MAFWTGLRIVRLFVLAKQVCLSLTDTLSAQSVCTCFNSTSKTHLVQKWLPVFFIGKKNFKKKITLFVSSNNNKGLLLLVFWFFFSSVNFRFSKWVMSNDPITLCKKTCRGHFHNSNIHEKSECNHFLTYISQAQGRWIKTREIFRVFYRKQNKLFHYQDRKLQSSNETDII
jgi:hypothetical protein